MAVIRREQYQRGPFGQVAKWIFVAFNLMMLFWFSSYLTTIAGIETDTDAGRIGLAIGSTIGATVILGIWAMGVVLLGMIVLVTRGEKVILEDAVSDGPTRRSWDVTQQTDEGIQKADEAIARYLQRAAQNAQAAEPITPAARNPVATFGKRRAS